MTGVRARRMLHPTSNLCAGPPLFASDHYVIAFSSSSPRFQALVCRHTIGYSRIWYVLSASSRNYNINSPFTAAFLALSAVSIRYLWRARAGQHTLGRRVLLPYTVVLLAFGTISILLDIYVSMHQLILAAFGQATETSTLEACSVMGVVSGLAHQLPLLISDGLLVSSIWSLKVSVLTFYLSALSHICDLPEEVDLHGTSPAVIWSVFS
jgi:hypothetical protein